MPAPDWTDGEVVEPPKLTTAQVYRLMRMTEVLRNIQNLDQVLQIKDSIVEDNGYALELWSEFTEEEQNALWVAPRFGGIFTTDERKALRP